MRQSGILMGKRIISYADVYWGRRQLNNVVKSSLKITYADIYWGNHKYVKHIDKPNVISREINFKPRSDP